MISNNPRMLTLDLAVFVMAGLLVAQHKATDQKPPAGSLTGESSPASQLIGLARDYFNDGNCAAATVAFDRALGLDPSLAVAHLYLAECSEADDAIPHARAAEEILRTQIQLRPRDRSLRVLLARSMALQKKNEAGHEYEDALALIPDEESGHRYYAEFLAWQNKFPEAIKECRKAIAIDASSAEAHKLLVSLLIHTDRDSKEILPEANRALELRPANPEFVFTLSRAMIAAHDAGGIEVAERALQMAAATTNIKERVRLLDALGFWYCDQAIQRYDDSIRVLTEAVSLTKSPSSFRYYRLGLAYEFKADRTKESSNLYASALENHRMAIQLDDADAAAHARIGTILFNKMQNRTESLTQMKRAAEIDSKYTEEYQKALRLSEAESAEAALAKPDSQEKPANPRKQEHE